MAVEHPAVQHPGEVRVEMARPGATTRFHMRTETSYTRPKDRKKEKPCMFCAKRARTIDYKAVGMLKEFLDMLGNIKPARKTFLCPRHQRMLTTAIKRARFIALLPNA